MFRCLNQEAVGVNEESHVVKASILSSPDVIEEGEGESKSTVKTQL
jgi:hypothetical protein